MKEVHYHFATSPNWLQRQDSNLRFLAYETKRMTSSILCDKWCPLRESNSQPRITKPMLCHLTKGAKNNRIDFTFQVTSLKYLIAVTILKLVEDSGIEPLTQACKASVFPIRLIPRNLLLTIYPSLRRQ